MKMRSFTTNISVGSPVSASSFFTFKRSGTAIPSTIGNGCKQVKAGGVTVAVAGGDSASCSSHLSPIPVRRRQLLYLSTVSFVVPFHDCIFMQTAAAFANAAADENYYIKEEILKVLSKGKAAGVLRLVFHDAGTYENSDKRGGMNGSIVYELDRPENKGLKKSVKILEKAKSQIDIIQPISWSDIIAVAGAVAVSLCGGPSIDVKLGRIDSSGPDPEGKLPEETLDAVGLKQCFQQKGFSTQELVALSGAHTLGSKGFGDPFVFDNSYYKILLEKPWLPAVGMSAMIGLPSDRALVEDDECKRWITEYANNQELFFEDFKNAYIKLVNAGAKWSS